MKRTKVLLVLSLLIIVIIGIGCKKDISTVTKKTTVKKSINSKDILNKVIDKYKEQPISDIKFIGNNELTVDKNKKINLVVVFHNYFLNNDMKKCITNLNMKLNVDKSKNHIDLYMNEYGNVGYALNDKIYYSADDMYSMLGIKYSAPEFEIDKSNTLDEVEATDDIYKIDEDYEENDDDNAEESGEEIDLFEEELDIEEDEDDQNEEDPSLRKTYSLDHISNLANRLYVKGNKEYNGKECYVLKGVIDSVEIRNILVTYLETALYNIPKDIGDVKFDIYVDKKTYEIHGVAFDCSEVISKLTGSKKNSDNILEFTMSYNTGSKITFPKVKESTVDCYDAVLTAMDSISKALK